MPEPDPYDQFLADTLAEWAADEDAEYLKFYPQTTTMKDSADD